MDEPHTRDGDSAGESASSRSDSPSPIQGSLPATDPSRLSRRRMLASLGAGAAGVAGLAGSATAQEGPAQVTTTFVIESVEEFSRDLNSQFAIIVSQQREPDSVPGFGDCDGVTWEVTETVAYEGLIVDRLSQDPRGVERQFYAEPGGDPMGPGTTFVINNATECDGFVVLEVETVGAAQFPTGTQTTDTATGGGPIPGFTGWGALAALGSLLGLGALRRFHRDDGDD